MPTHTACAFWQAPPTAHFVLLFRSGAIETIAYRDGALDEPIVIPSIYNNNLPCLFVHLSTAAEHGNYFYAPWALMGLTRRLNNFSLLCKKRFCYLNCVNQRRTTPANNGGPPNLGLPITAGENGFFHLNSGLICHQ